MNNKKISLKYARLLMYSSISCLVGVNLAIAMNTDENQDNKDKKGHFHFIKSNMENKKDQMKPITDEQEYEVPYSLQEEEDFSNLFERKIDLGSTPIKQNNPISILPSSDPTNLTKSKSKIMLEAPNSDPTNLIKSKSRIIPEIPVYSLVRETTGRITNRYFKKHTVIHRDGYNIHDQIRYEENLPILQTINTFWCLDTKGELKKKWEDTFYKIRVVNHLTCKLFCVLKDVHDNDNVVTYESPVFVKSLLHSKHQDKPYYKFSVTKDGHKKQETSFIDFVSSTPLHSQEKITEEGFLTLEKSQNRPHVFPQDQEITNHGDLMALYTLKSNKDLFFKLIKKNGHRDDYKILSFGTRFFSSFDACEDCNSKIYKKIYGQSGLREALQTQLAHEYYTLNGIELPFHTLFYSYRPYINNTKYVVSYGDQRSAESLASVATYAPKSDLNSNDVYKLTNSSNIFYPRQIDCIGNNVPNDWNVIYSHSALLDKTFTDTLN
jgi:hypothetical protein